MPVSSLSWIATARTNRNPTRAWREASRPDRFQHRPQRAGQLPGTRHEPLSADVSKNSERSCAEVTSRLRHPNGVLAPNQEQK